MTHPLGHNYGGIAQAFALQTILRELGFEPETTWSLGPTWKQFLLSNATFRKLYGLPDSNAQKRIDQNTKEFITKHITLTSFKEAKSRSNRNYYDVFLTGSDQVWRKLYAHVPHYLFSFVLFGRKQFYSYAASFGADNVNEYNATLRFYSRLLARRFKSISVRESSGVSIVEKEWGLPAYQHIDPTMLVKKETYTALINEAKITQSFAVKSAFVYVLDNNAQTSEWIQLALEGLRLNPYYLISDSSNSGNQLPPFESWLSCFNEAEFVITDSFHGTVFSIIFEKPFLCIANDARGTARVESLLSTFGLMNRLISNSKPVDPSDLFSPIDWASVRTKLKTEQERSLCYLQSIMSAQ